MLTQAINGTFSEKEYDETELSRLESKWKQYFAASRLSMEKVQQERRNIQETVSDISHQMKTPLANILLYTELLREQAANEQEKYLAEQIAVYSRKMEFLTEALVKMSRLESGMFVLKPERQEVYPMLLAACEALRQKAESREMTVTLPGDRGEKACYDRKWTQEAVCNLLDNAIKYSPRGSRIRIDLTGYERFVCISVRDEGIGIGEEDRAKIFTRFYRGRQVQQEEGVGIGLYLAREIVRRESGYMKAESKEGEGSTFKIYLPA